MLKLTEGIIILIYSGGTTNKYLDLVLSNGVFELDKGLQVLLLTEKVLFQQMF
jgi:hypothetical protein